VRYYCIPGHPHANERGIVPADKVDLVEETHAVNAPVLSGRFYENQKMLDGTDVGSRKKYHNYLDARGLAPVSDFKQTWSDAEKRRAKFYTEGGDEREHKARREIVGRAWYDHVVQGRKRHG
jgi:hypothetical protein